MVGIPLARYLGRLTKTEHEGRPLYAIECDPPLRGRHVPGRFVGYKQGRPYYHVPGCTGTPKGDQRIVKHGRLLHPRHRGRPLYAYAEPCCSGFGSGSGSGSEPGSTGGSVPGSGPGSAGSGPPGGSGSGSGPAAGSAAGSRGGSERGSAASGGSGSGSAPGSVGPRGSPGSDTGPVAGGGSGSGSGSGSVAGSGSGAGSGAGSGSGSQAGSTADRGSLPPGSPPVGSLGGGSGSGSGGSGSGSGVGSGSGSEAGSGVGSGSLSGGSGSIPGSGSGSGGGVTVACCPDALPATLYATISGGPFCPGFVGLTVVLAWDGAGSWVGQVAATPGQGVDGEYVRLALHCGGADAGGFTLDVDCSNTTGSTGNPVDPGGTCSPVSLTFGGIVQAGPCCGLNAFSFLVTA